MDCSIRPTRFKDIFIVSTLDFFYPLVEDPYAQGRIAAANVLSDMYSFGISDVDNVLMVLAASLDMTVRDRETVTKLMIKGFDDTCKEAGTLVTGGQTVYNPWPIIGGAAMSVLKLEDMIMPTGAVEGDVIVLTKPLGTQVSVNLMQWLHDDKKWATVKDIISKEDVLRSFDVSQKSMIRLNRNAAGLMRKYGAHAATDVTGFGLLGHAANLASNQTAKVNFVIHSLPIIKNMVAVHEAIPIFKLTQGYSAETSGGLFLAIPKDKAADFCAELEKMDGVPAWIIGDVVQGDNKAEIVEKVKIIEY